MTTPQQPPRGFATSLPPGPPGLAPEPPRRGLRRRSIALLAVGGGLATVALIAVVVLVAVHVLGSGDDAAGSPTAAAGPPLVAIWLKDTASSTQVDQIQRAGQSRPEVRSLTYVSRNESARAIPSLPAGLRPASPTAYLLLHLRDARAVNAVRSTFTSLPGVAAVRVSS